MNIQQAMEQLEEQLMGQDILSCQTNNERFFLLSLWKKLQQFTERYSSLHLLPGIEKGKWKCEAILLSQGGIYVFHLLPLKMIEVDIQHSGIKVVYSTKEDMDERGHLIEEIFYLYGRSCLMIEGLQQPIHNSPLPVYEFYIASDQYSHLLWAGDGKVVISIPQLEELFSRYEFRPNPSYEQLQKELYQCLTDWPRGAELELKQPSQDHVGDDRRAAELLQSPPGRQHAVDQTTLNLLPPRQSRKKKHNHSWLHKFFK